jgi:hypothetical protein
MPQHKTLLRELKGVAIPNAFLFCPLVKRGFKTMVTDTTKANE